MNAPTLTPRTAEFIKKEHVAHDAMWIRHAETIERENIQLRGRLEDAIGRAHDLETQLEDAQKDAQDAQ